MMNIDLNEGLIIINDDFNEDPNWLIQSDLDDMNIDTYLHYVWTNYTRKSWRHLKVLPLDEWMKHDSTIEELEKEYEQINPIFERDGKYYFQGFCWFEINGKSYVDKNPEQFVYELKINDAPVYRESVYKALLTLRNENMLSEEQEKNLRTYEEAEMTREVYRNSRKMSLSYRKTNNDDDD